MMFMWRISNGLNQTWDGQILPLREALLNRQGKGVWASLAKIMELVRFTEWRVLFRHSNAVEAHAFMC